MPDFSAFRGKGRTMKLKEETKHGKEHQWRPPDSFPLEQEKLNFTIPVTDQPREKVAKLVQTITDRVPVKLKGVKGNDPEYWALRRW